MYKYAIEGNEVSEQEFCLMLNKPHDLVIDDVNDFKCIYPSTNNNFTIYGTYNDYKVTCEDCRNCLNCVNCEICDNCDECTNCKLCNKCSECTNCKLCNKCNECTNCALCYCCNNCENSINCEYSDNCTNCDKCSYCRNSVNLTYCNFCDDCKDCEFSSHLSYCKSCELDDRLCMCIDCKNCEYCEYCDHCCEMWHAWGSSRCMICSFIKECYLCTESKFLKQCCLCNETKMSRKLLMSEHSFYSHDSSLLTHCYHCSETNKDVYINNVKTMLQLAMNTYIKKIHIHEIYYNTVTFECVDRINPTLFSSNKDTDITEYLPNLFKYLFKQNSELPSELQTYVLPDFKSFAYDIQSKLNMTCNDCYYCTQLTNSSNCKLCDCLTNCNDCVLSNLSTDCNHCNNSSLLEYCDDCHYTRNSFDTNDCYFCEYIESCDSIIRSTTRYNNYIDFNDKNLFKASTNIIKYLNAKLVETIDCKCGCGRRVEILSLRQGLQIYICYNEDNEVVYIGSKHVGIIFQNYFDYCIINDNNIVYKIGYFDNLNPLQYLCLPIQILSCNDAHIPTNVLIKDVDTYTDGKASQEHQCKYHCSNVLDSAKFYGTMYSRTGEVIKINC